MAARAYRKPTPDPAPIALPPTPPAFGAFAIDDLALFRCRFICSADRAPVRYCGRPTTPGAGNKHGSWCAEHLPVVFEAWVPGGRVLRRAGRV